MATDRVACELADQSTKVLLRLGGGTCEHGSILDKWNLFNDLVQSFEVIARYLPLSEPNSQYRKFHLHSTMSCCQ